MSHKFWIKLYVAVLLIVMGVCSLLTSKTFANYRPKWMFLFCGTGRFQQGNRRWRLRPRWSPSGGLLAGVPVKSMVAVTSLAEGATCLFAVIVWFALLSSGVVVDYLLLPSFVIGTVLAAVGAPYTTRILPEKFWKICVPVYCCILAVLCFWKTLAEHSEKSFSS